MMVSRLLFGFPPALAIDDEDTARLPFVIAAPTPFRPVEVDGSPELADIAGLEGGWRMASRVVGALEERLLVALRRFVRSTVPVMLTLSSPTLLLSLPMSGMVILVLSTKRVGWA